MNIFVTDANPVKCAEYLDDKRVIKMCTESVQLLCTALSEFGVTDTPVKPTHRNHPCAVWVRSSRQNYLWLLRHTVALMHEKRKRYPENKPHLYEQHINYLHKHVNLLPNTKLTPFVNCASRMDLDINYKDVDDVFLAYQMYLNDRWDTDKRTPTWYRA